MPVPPPGDADLLVIGGGLCGLTAAVAHAQARRDQRVVLLEARPRVYCAMLSGLQAVDHLLDGELMGGRRVP